LRFFFPATLVVAGDFQSSWSISRPLLVLILLDKPHFLTTVQEVLTHQSPDAVAHVSKCFDSLLDNVSDSNVTPKNRDVFTRNLYQFIQNLKDTRAGVSVGG
jgi:exportin-7